MIMNRILKKIKNLILDCRNYRHRYLFNYDRNVLLEPQVSTEHSLSAAV
jgi:hypothetical protein